MKKVAFIVGAGRSGTTMLAQTLNAHSRICVPHELQLVFGYSGNGPRLYEYFATGEARDWRASDFVKKVGELCPHQFDEFFDYESFFNARNYPEEGLGAMLSDLYSAIARSRGKDMLVEQTPWYGQRLDIMKALFPEAKFIHMIRDGRDVAISFARTPWWHDNPAENLERWQQEVNKIASDALQLLDKTHYLEIRYEDFVEDPESNVRRIIDFLGLVYESEMLVPENLIDYTIYRKRDMSAHMSNAFNKWSAERDKPVFADNIYGWKRSSPELFNAISHQARESLRRLGYDA